jgi:hypothetical protein
MAFYKLDGWARSVDKATGKADSVTWHAFSVYWAGDPNPASLCGEKFAAISKTRPLSGVTGEVCRSCRTEVEQNG